MSRILRNPTVTLAALLVALALPAPVLSAEASSAQTIPVAGSFDNTPFSYRMELHAEKEAFRVYRLTYPSPVRTAIEQNNTVPAELYLPKGLARGPKRPAVICLHILDGNVELCQIACSSLASRGIPAIWFSLPYYHQRATKGGRHDLAADPKLFTAAITQGIEDVRRTIDVLAARPEIDAQRIGVMGISLGGFLAASSAERDPRIARTAMILSGGDVLNIIHTCREARELSVMLRRLPPGTKTEVERAIDEVDPLRHADRLRERAIAGKVLMINATADEVVPRAAAEKLAAALGMSQRVVWLEGLGHYTAMAALPQALRTMVAFFAEDLPAEVKAPAPAARSPQRTVVSLLQQAGELLVSEPKAGRCHLADLELSLAPDTGRRIEGRIRVVRGPRPKFAIYVKVPEFGEASLGQGEYPWMAVGKKVVFKGIAGRPSVGDSGGVGSPAPNARPNAQNTMDLLTLADPKQTAKLRMLAGALTGIGMAPDVLDRWVTISEATAEGRPAVVITRKDRSGDSVQLKLQDDRVTPESAALDVQGVRGTLTFHAWQFNAVAHDSMFREPAGVPVKEVDPVDLVRTFTAALNFGLESIRIGPSGGPARPATGPKLEIVARDPAGHGLLCRSQGKRVLLVAGTPEQMGAAQGRLLGESMRKLAERVLYAVGGADSLQSGTWFFDRLAEIERRTSPHVPPRFVAECDALSRAVGVSLRDGRYANLFPERFHCSGVAVCGKATRDGRVLHARVLDYMRDIRLQDEAAVQVFMPEGRNAWMSLGYAGFIGTVTAMNEKGLAIGEMGGRGEGDWDGVPMSFLLRDIMERASTVEEALDIFRRSPRTCEYYYVISDKSRAMAGLHCVPKKMTVLRPGQQHPMLPLVPENTVLMSGDSRAKVLSQRLQQRYGKIDVPTMIDIIKRPVAMRSNLHDAIFSPETLEMWCADAGPDTPACDEPYARFDMAELLRFCRAQTATSSGGN